MCVKDSHLYSRVYTCTKLMLLYYCTRNTFKLINILGSWPLGCFSLALKL